jgi:hypothetical protein
VPGRAHGPPPDLRVRRCTVRVRRSDGWAWGEPGELVPEVLDAVEAALAELVTKVGTVDADVRVTTPVRLAIGPLGVGLLVDGVDDLVSLVHEEVARAAVAPRSSAEPPTVPPEVIGPDLSTGREMRTRTWAALASVLARWSRDGRLDLVVSTWSPEIRSAWVTALAEGALDPEAATQTWSSSAVSAIADRVLAPSDAPSAAADAAARMLVFVGAMAAAAQDRLPDAEALEVVRRLVGLPDVGARSAGLPAGSLDGPQATVAPPAPRVPTGDPVAGSSQPVVVPALPFLVVVQLHRLAYLAPAGAALAVGGLPDAERVLAGLVAGKALPPPVHGWRREDADATAVSLVAGMPVRQLAERVALASWSADTLAPLAAVLAGLYADDPDPDGLVLTRLEDSWICGEAGGLPIGWGSGPGELTALLGQLGAGDLLEGDLFSELADRLRAQRAAPGVVAGDLERHLGAVVGAALGSLAAELWGPSAGPLTALDRLHDLDGRAVAGPDGLVIALPRGQRWLDLRRAGLLDTWSLPWAPGGRWELVTW